MFIYIILKKFTLL